MWSTSSLSVVNTCTRVCKLHDLFLVLADYQISAAYVLTPYSADKLVPLSPFSNRKFIDCLSFIERMDRLCFKDMMIVNKHS